MDIDNDGYLVIPSPHRVLDCSGLLCPLPVIYTSKAIREIAIGQVLHLITTDPGAPLDMRAWSRMTGHALLDACEMEGAFHFYFERTR